MVGSNKTEDEDKGTREEEGMELEERILTQENKSSARPRAGFPFSGITFKIK